MKTQIDMSSRVKLQQVFQALIEVKNSPEDDQMFVTKLEFCTDMLQLLFDECGAADKAAEKEECLEFVLVGDDDLKSGQPGSVNSVTVLFSSNKVLGGHQEVKEFAELFRDLLIRSKRYIYLVLTKAEYEKEQVSECEEEEYRAGGPDTPKRGKTLKLSGEQRVIPLNSEGEAENLPDEELLD